MNTTHAERGGVTVSALVAILGRISPDVVFAEIPQSHAARYADGSHGTLESRAVAEFGKHNKVAVVPVDRPEPAEEFFRVTRELFELVERQSRDFRNLVDLQSESIARGGFRYLNSADCAAAEDAIRDEVHDTIDWLRAPHLHETHDLWLKEIELRDQEMIAQIERHAAMSQAASAVLLVGAAHRRSIISKAQANVASSTSNVEWQFVIPSEWFE